MTTETKTAGYFDQKRNCPMYVGDVYVLPFEDPEFFKIVKKETEGIKVNQVGTANVFALSEIGKRFVEEGKFIGNEFENPHTIDAYLAECNAASEAEYAEATATKTSEIDEKIAAVEQANEELKEANAELKENIETMFDAASEEKREEENEQICSTDSDVTNVELQENTDEGSTDSDGTNPEGNEPAEDDNKPTEESETGAVSAEATTGKNVIVETASKAVPEVIANTADEKAALLRVKLLNKHIDENNAQIIQLQDKVEYHSQLASTLTYEPFVKLKSLVSEALHSNVDDENVKGIKERTKDFESIINIQNLLKDHQRAADKAENDIADLEDEIAKFEEEIASLNEKIDTFARQTKLNLASVTAQSKTEEMAEAVEK